MLMKIIVRIQQHSCLKGSSMLENGEMEKNMGLANILKVMKLIKDNSKTMFTTAKALYLLNLIVGIHILKKELSIKVITRND
jgi:hypothetical protein